MTDYIKSDLKCANLPLSPNSQPKPILKFCHIGLILSYVIFAFKLYLIQNLMDTVI